MRKFSKVALSLVFLFSRALAASGQEPNPNFLRECQAPEQFSVAHLAIEISDCVFVSEETEGIGQSSIAQRFAI